MTAKTTNRYRVLRGIFAAAVAVGASVPVASAAPQSGNPVPRSENARQYSACMALARKVPKAAQDSALAWHEKGGGDAAVHCGAVALLGLGEYEQAGLTMQELAARIDASRTKLKAGLLGQAANAWLIAGRPKKAETLLTEALQLLPKDVETLVDRSIARASMGKYWDALDDLNDALDRSPNRADVLTFRAAAWRHVDALDLAQQDITAALKQRPIYPDSLLERGLIRQARGDLAGARADWLHVLDIAVEGPLTEAARRHLEAIDVRKTPPK
jgi:tetratricopeptide (TPR) repeat protein